MIDGILVISTIMGVLGAFLNLASAYEASWEIRDSRKTGKYVNNVMVLAISCGDLLTSIYLLTLTYIHCYIGSEFCERQFEWISGQTCEIIGVLNTTGGTISSLVMALVSCFRLHGTLQALRYRRSEEVTTKLKIKLMLILGGIVVFAVGVAVLPLIDSLDDWFVNGLIYQDIPLFLGAMGKNQLLNIVRIYHGNHESSGTSVSWKTLQNLVSEMFSHDYNGSTSGTKLSFYGNDPVCMFKAFVLPDDPQAGYVWLYLSFHLFCFVTVAICHMIIAIYSKKTRVQNSNATSSLGRKVTLICFTDFCCWMPFLICCALHTAEMVDMSPWYQIFSLNILPLNSVLNPLLYSNIIAAKLGKLLKMLQPARAPSNTRQEEEERPAEFTETSN
eukprot:sb/3465565/